MNKLLAIGITTIVLLALVFTVMAIQDKKITEQEIKRTCGSESCSKQNEKFCGCKSQFCGSSQEKGCSCANK